MTLLAAFFLYSFLGLWLEQLYAYLTNSRRKGRKCLLFLPFCPVYGLGAVLILSLASAVADQPLLLFFCSALAATGAELLLSLWYRRLWRTAFWDYSGLPFQLGGHICLLFSLAWGGLGVVLVRLLHPALEPLLKAVPNGAVVGLTAAFLVDSYLTGHLLRRRQDPSALRWWVTAPPADGGSS